METKERYGYEPDYAVPPGETLQEIIDSLGMTQRQLAARTGLTVQTVVRIIKGEQPITYTTANLLELATGVPARLWNSLEAQYREHLAKLEERERMRADLDWLDGIPVKELQARNLVGRHTDKVLVLRDTLAFYGVGSVEAWQEIWEAPEVAARRSTCFETCAGPAAAWIRQGELIAQRIPCAPYGRAGFMEALKSIRELTGERSAVFRPEMVRRCAVGPMCAAWPTPSGYRPALSRGDSSSLPASGVSSKRSSGLSTGVPRKRAQPVLTRHLAATRKE